MFIFSFIFCGWRIMLGWLLKVEAWILLSCDVPIGVSEILWLKILICPFLCSLLRRGKRLFKLTNLLKNQFVVWRENSMACHEIIVWLYYCYLVLCLNRRLWSEIVGRRDTLTCFNLAASCFILSHLHMLSGNLTCWKMIRVISRHILAVKSGRKDRSGRIIGGIVKTYGCWLETRSD